MSQASSAHVAPGSSPCSAAPVDLRLLLLAQAASLDLRRSGTGTIALKTPDDTRLSYLVCWPHVRPWRMRHTEPARGFDLALWVATAALRVGALLFAGLQRRYPRKAVG